MSDDTGNPGMTLKDWAQALIDATDTVDAQLRGYERENIVLRQCIFEELKPSDASCSHNVEVIHAVHNGERVPDVH